MDNCRHTEVQERDRKGASYESVGNKCEVLLSCDTLQFDDYSKYDTDYFDVSAKRKRHEEVFPIELDKAFSLGKELMI